MSEAAITSSENSSLEVNNLEEASFPPLETDKPTIGKKLRAALEKWWYQAGPGSVENAFVEAHAKIVSRIENKDRKQAFINTEKNWRDAGHKFGIASTVIDFGLSGIFGFVSISALLKPEKASDFIGIALTKVDARNPIQKYILAPLNILSGASAAREDSQKKKAGQILAGISGVIPAAELIGVRPGHIAAKMAAKAAEVMYVGKAKSDNYIDSGKAAGHANKLGKAAGTVVSSAGKYMAENPELVKEGFRVTRDIANERKRIEAEKQRLAVIEKERKKQVRLIQLRQEYLSKNHDYLVNKYGELKNVPEGDVYAYIQNTYGEQLYRELTS